MVSHATLRALNAHAARGAEHPPHHAVEVSNRDSRSQGLRGYGEPVPCPDQNGYRILALPRDFRYVTFSRIGAPMSNGNPTPRNHDGMGAFAGQNDTVRLIRNHEVRNDPGDRNGAVEGPTETRYDPLGVAGTVTIDFDIRSLGNAKRYPPVARDFVSLNGTIVNCSGGHAFGDAGWITCEEAAEGPGFGWRRKHGYAFLTPVAADTTARAQPIVAMGRFKHEAAISDAATGIVYQTEDDGSTSGFYRFLPKDPSRLLAGGVLQTLRLAGKPRADLREGQTIGRRLLADWVTIDDPDPDLENGAPTVFRQGFHGGGARFNRLEGMFRGDDGSIYFTSSRGGDVKSGLVDDDGYAKGYGQIWRYLPGTSARGELELVFESPGGSVLECPDNVCVTPGGGLLVCEDTNNANRLIGFTSHGKPFEFAVNLLNSSEFAGTCFSPAGSILFVNIFGDGTQGSGMTCAITGPWHRGPL